MRQTQCLPSYCHQRFFRSEHKEKEATWIPADSISGEDGADSPGTLK